MIADSYYLKALANFKTAKIVFATCPTDEEQLNVIGYHLQQALELAIKHIFMVNGAPIQKSHDIDQLITFAKSKNIELYLTDYLKENSEIISLWESKTRYVLGYALEAKKVSQTIDELDIYFSKLSKLLKY